MSRDEPARLCIIGGYQRSGTRNFADLCQAHSRVRLFGEVSRYAWPNVRATLKEIGDYHKRTAGKREGRFERSRHMIALNILAMHAKTPTPGFNIEDFERCTVGFKTPRIEWFWKDLIDLFGSMNGRKVFLYSCRTVEEVFLSRASLGWSDNVQSFLAKLKNSLASILDFQEHLSRKDAGGWTIRALHLNSYIASEDRGRWLVDHLYSLVAPEVTADEAASYAAGTANRNATVKVTGQDRRRTLTSEEREEFEQDRELRDFLARFNETFSVQVRVFSGSD